MKIWIAMLLLVANSAYASKLVDTIEKDLDKTDVTVQRRGADAELADSQHKPSGINLGLGPSIFAQRRVLTLDIYDGPVNSYLISRRSNPATIILQFKLFDGTRASYAAEKTLVKPEELSKYKDLAQRIRGEVTARFNFVKLDGDLMLVQSKDLPQEQFNDLIDFILGEMLKGSEAIVKTGNAEVSCEGRLTNDVPNRRAANF